MFEQKTLFQQQQPSGKDLHQTPSLTDSPALTDDDKDSVHSSSNGSGVSPKSGFRQPEARMGLFILLLSSIPTTTLEEGHTTRSSSADSTPTHTTSALQFIQQRSEGEGIVHTSEDALVVEETMKFLALRDLLVLRGVNKRVASVVHQKYVKVYPGGEIFVHWNPSTTRSNPAPPCVLQWNCTFCGNRTPYTKCTNCGEFQSEPSTTRLFVGQLRRRDTVMLLVWMLAMVLPNVQVTHIDNHKNHRDADRGRGCAWIHLRQEDSHAVLDLHKRILIDQSPEGYEDGEGFWIVPNDTEQMQQLTLFAEGRTHRDIDLPRRTLVVEPAAGTPSPSTTSSYYPPSSTKYSHHSNNNNNNNLSAASWTDMSHHNNNNSQYCQCISCVYGPTACEGVQTNSRTYYCPPTMYVPPANVMMMDYNTQSSFQPQHHHHFVGGIPTGKHYAANPYACGCPYCVSPVTSTATTTAILASPPSSLVDAFHLHPSYQYASVTYASY